MQKIDTQTICIGDKFKYILQKYIFVCTYIVLYFYLKKEELLFHH